jgi:NAD(P)H-hydrate repair Nnr-like enzyme with NAD(P)H-hydrate dehydratase domain
MIEVDPASIISLPGDREDAATTGDSLAGLVAGVPSQTTGASLAAAASTRWASTAASPPDGPTMLAVVLVMLVVVTTALAVAGKGVRSRRRKGQ